MSNPQTEKGPGKPVTVDIHDVAFGGDGVGRMDGKAVFVPFTCAGETVEIECVTHYARFARGRLGKVLRPSVDRVLPACPLFGRCGGCRYQHMSYPAQLRVKQRQVADLIERIARAPEIPVHPVVPCPSPWGYRSRITLHGPGAPAYHGLDPNERVPVSRCPIAGEPLNEALSAWRAAYPEGLPEGGRLQLRMDGGGHVRMGTDSDRLPISYELLGHSFELPPDSFFQVNRDMAELLVQAVRVETETRGPCCLIDAYAGVGLFGFLCAMGTGRVHLIESDRQAMHAARRNARAMKIKQVVFHPSKVERALPGILSAIPASETLCILDPPRAGCSRSVLDGVARAEVQTLLYISCAPDRLARDTRILLDQGYRCAGIRLFDMFPQTAHLEALAVYERAG